jgi:hypothetical protein
MSLVEGIVADDSRKIRGDRANIVLYEEAGSNPKLESSVIKGEELVNPGGNKIGISIIGGRYMPHYNRIKSVKTESVNTELNPKIAKGLG